jgi:hypothetical protein
MQPKSMGASYIVSVALKVNSKGRQQQQEGKRVNSGTLKVAGTYSRLKDGREIVYWGRISDFYYEVRIYPAETPPTNLLDLPIRIRGRLPRIGAPDDI